MSTLQTLGGLEIEHDPNNEQPVDAPIQIRDPIDMMPASSFESSNVHSGLYDFGEAELFMRYLRDGPDAIYQYTGVPPSVWDGLVNAQSKGRFVNANIAYQYPYAKASASDFPDRGRGLQSDIARRFVTTP